MLELDEMAPGPQMPVLEDLFGRPDHPPRQSRTLAQFVQGLAVVLLGQPLEGAPHLAVVAGAVHRISEGGIRQRPRHPFVFEHLEHPREHVRSEEVGVEGGHLPTV